MKRLHKLTDEQINDWYNQRVFEGKLKYTDKHLDRYNLVDVMEELMDAKRITNLFIDRMSEQEVLKELSGDEKLAVNEMLDQLFADIYSASNILTEIDELIPDKYCTDGEGGERVWW